MDAVGPVLADEEVVALAAQQQVDAGAAVQIVGAGAAVHLVGTVSSVHPIGARAADHAVGALAPEHEIGTVLPEQDVRAGPADEPIATRPANQHVVPADAAQRVVPAEAADHVAVVRPAQHVPVRGADDRATVAEDAPRLRGSRWRRRRWRWSRRRRRRWRRGRRRSGWRRWWRRRRRRRRRAGGVVVQDRPHSHAVLDRRVGGAGELDEERLVGLHLGVAVHGDADVLRRLAGREGERAARCRVVGGRLGRPVGGVVVDRDRLLRRAGQGHRERRRRGARAPLGDAHVPDRQRGERVVVDDRALALPVAEDDVARDDRQVHEVVLVLLVDRVAVNLHDERSCSSGRGQRSAGVVIAP